jgi:TPP-dependent pyruvate/acetoin dehydrogenase alpha subunit
VSRPAASEVLDRERALPFLHAMLRIRRFEEKCAELYTATKIRGFLHLYIGEEAIAAGAMPALRPEDAVFATYREHGHALARGVGMGPVMAEMYGKVEGCSRGRGGSMHLFDLRTRFYGGNAIVGGALPMAVGLALAQKMQGRPEVTACFFGEGAVAEGEFHESMNLAELWRLPVLFLCENNRYAMGTALERSESQTDLVQKARSYNVPAGSVDGMDVLAVHAAAHRAADAARSGGGPPFRTGPRPRSRSGVSASRSPRSSRGCSGSRGGARACSTTSSSRSAARSTPPCSSPSRAPGSRRPR